MRTSSNNLFRTDGRQAQRIDIITYDSQGLLETQVPPLWTVMLADPQYAFKKFRVNYSSSGEVSFDQLPPKGDIINSEAFQKRQASLEESSAVLERYLADQFGAPQDSEDSSQASQDSEDSKLTVTYDQHGNRNEDIPYHWNEKLPKFNRNLAYQKFNVSVGHDKELILEALPPAGAITTTAQFRVQQALKSREGEEITRRILYPSPLTAASSEGEEITQGILNPSDLTAASSDLSLPNQPIAASSATASSLAPAMRPASQASSAACFFADHTATRAALQTAQQRLLAAIGFRHSDPGM